MPIATQLYYSCGVATRSSPGPTGLPHANLVPADASRRGFAIGAKGVSKSYGRSDVLRGLDLSVDWGETAAALGPNGSGKTTLLRLLSGLARPDAGAIRVAGLDPSRSGEEVRRAVGVVTHEPLLYDDLSGYENLRFVGRMFRLDRIEERIEEVAARLDVASRLHQRVSLLSHGLRKRFTIARALLHEPRVLLLDEPESGLDRQGVTILERVVRGHAEAGGAALMTTHDLDWAVETADRLSVLASGRILHSGTAQDPAAFRAAYDRHTEVRS